jgi:tetratricopeptide (TPR) repeat protein
MILCDRYLYVTLMLIGSTIAAVLSALRSPRLQRLVVLIAAVVVFIEAATTLQNHPLWWHHHALFERTAQCAPESRAATYNYGRLLVAEGNYEEALPFLRTSVKVEPRYSKAWLALGAAHLYAGRPESALAAFRRTEELSGPFAPVAVNSALALLDMEDTTAAVSELRRALSISPTYAPAAEALEKLSNVRRVSVDSCLTLQ